MTDGAMIYRFLRKVLFFMIWIAIVVFISSSALNSHLGKKAEFKLDKNITSVVFGHSQAECAYNDSLISNFRNLAQSGDSYYYSYIKARRIFKDNPQLKRVFIEFSNIDVALSRDSDIWEGDLLNWKYPIYTSLMEGKDYKFLMQKNPLGIIKSLPKTIKKQLKRISNNHFNYLPATSGYLYLTESKLDSLLHSKTHELEPKSDYFKESKANLYYLELLLKLCNEKNLEVFLIRSPMYQKSYFQDNEGLYQEIKSERFGEFKLLDFSTFSIGNDEFRDLNHLNNKGARKFSKWFNNQEFLPVNNSKK